MQRHLFSMLENNFPVSRHCPFKTVAISDFRLPRKFSSCKSSPRFLQNPEFEPEIERRIDSNQQTLDNVSLEEVGKLKSKFNSFQPLRNSDLFCHQFT